MRVKKNQSMEAVYTRLNENIRLLLAKYDMYPAELAAMMGMNRRTFSGRRKAPWTFTLGEIEEVAKYLRVDVATLMFGDVAPTNPFKEA